MDIATKLTDLQTDLHECRRAITYRGGEISATAGFKEVAEKIVSLPASSSIGTVIDENTSALKVVPSNSTKYCYLKALGGMTYRDTANNTLVDTKSTTLKVHGANLIPFPYYLGGAGFTQTKGGITFTINPDRSISLSGTAKGTPAFDLVDYLVIDGKLDLPVADYYTLSANHISGEWVSGVSVYGHNGNDYYYTSPTSPTIRVPYSGKRTWFSVRVINGTVINGTITFKPMFNAGSVAVPYADYHEPITYAIPEALQGTGKGVEGASDTIDFENGKKIIKTKTIRLGDVGGWQANAGVDATTGLCNIYTYSLNDFSDNLRDKALCSHLPTHTDWRGTTRGVCLQPDPRYCRVVLSATELGIANDADKIVVVGACKKWLQDTQATLTYAIAEPTETDIDTSGFNPLIEVEQGGSIEFITDSGYAPNSTVIYQTIV